MDTAADLTLQIICFLQADSEPPCSAVRWAFVPGPGRGRLTYAEAAAHLATMEKPIVIGALAHPGYVALWRPSAIDDNERPHIEHTLNNQVGGLEDFLSELKIDDSGLVRFEGLGRHVDVPVPILREWLGAYALTWGWTLGWATDASHHARLFAMRRFGQWSPGRTCGPRQ